MPWLWCRPVVTALIGPLVWEPPYATAVALKKKKEKKRSGNQNLFGILWMVFRTRMVTKGIKVVIVSSFPT